MHKDLLAIGGLCAFRFTRPDWDASLWFAVDIKNLNRRGQKINEWDMEGHAQKAKELLDQVNNELKLVAEAVVST